MVKSCPICQQFGRPVVYASLRSIQDDFPLQFIAIDVLGPFEPIQQGNRYILLVVDMHIHYLETFGRVIPTTDIHSLINFIPSLWFQWWGSPLVFMTNASTSFWNNAWRSFCQEHHISHIHTRAYMSL